MADVFISYNREEQTTARRFAEALRQAGLGVWWDQTLAPGETFDQTIEAALREAKAVIVLWSKRSVASRWVRAEATLADSLGTLVPVLIEPCEPPIQFRLTQTADLSGWKGDESSPAWQTLVEHIHRMSGSERLVLTAQPRLPANASKKRMGLAIGGAAAVLAAIAGTWWMLGRENQPADAPAASAATAADAFAPPPNSVAVLPFVNMSGDSKDESFSDGLSEELLNSLVKVNGLQVSARTSSFSFKGKDADIQTIARALNVGAVLEGSVRRDGQNIRITAQLINAVNGYHLWSETFDRELKDILNLQSEIATTVASALKVKLLPEDRDRLAAIGSSSNPAAYDAFLRAIGIWSNPARTGEAQAREGLEAVREALRLDPDFALAHAAYAEALTSIGNAYSGTVQQVDELNREALEHADRAVQLAPQAAFGHAARAFIYERLLRHKEGIASVQKAFELAPNDARVTTIFVDILGKNPATLPQATEVAKRATELDPVSPVPWFSLGIAYYFGRRYDEAMAAFTRGRTIQSLPPGGSSMVLVDFAQGRIDDAIAKTQGLPDGWQRRTYLAIALHHKGDTAGAHEQVRLLKADFGDVVAYQYAQIHAQWGEKREALDWLATALRLKDGGLERIEVDPLLDPIRDDPKFIEIVRKVKSL